VPPEKKKSIQINLIHYCTPGWNNISENETCGVLLITATGLVIVIGILKRGPRQGALQSIP
jgi:hypothetical protein